MLFILPRWNHARNHASKISKSLLDTQYLVAPMKLNRTFVHNFLHLTRHMFSVGSLLSIVGHVTAVVEVCEVHVV